MMVDKNFRAETLDGVQLSAAENSGWTHVDGLTAESAKKTSDLLTRNHKLYHNRWNSGFHNHLAHHLLALWAMGATPCEIQDMWDYNVPYQAPIDRRSEHDPTEEPDLSDSAIFTQSLGKDEAYFPFLCFFKQEIAAKGVHQTLREYMLQEDERADDIHCRMYTDLVHPMIHLGCGLEFQQPSLIAEALAGACIHENWPKRFILAAENYARANPDQEPQSVFEVIKALRQDPVVTEGVKHTDTFNKIAGGLMKRVGGEYFAPYLSRIRVEPTERDLREKMSEMMSTASYIMAAAQQPDKRVAMDFVLLHNATLAGYYPAILGQDWLSNREKARLLGAKMRTDAILYAGCGCPALYPERISSYVPRHPMDGWQELMHRSIVYRDEGHAAKLIRALYATEQEFDCTTCSFQMQKQDILKIAHMSMDSIEIAMDSGGSDMPEQHAKMLVKNIGTGGEMVRDNFIRWVFYGGLLHAWDFIPSLVPATQAH